MRDVASPWANILMSINDSETEKNTKYYLLRAVTSPWADTTIPINEQNKKNARDFPINP